MRVFSSPRVFADDHMIESALNNALQKKLVIIRGFYTGEHLRFDSSGNPVGKAAIVPWRLTG